MSYHVSQQLSAYCLGELPTDESRRVAEHLLSCSRCRQEYDEVRLGIKFTSELEPVAAPGDLWNQLVARLGTSAPGSYRSAFFWPRTIAVAATFLVLVLGAVWYLSRVNEDSHSIVKTVPPPPPSVEPPLPGLGPGPTPAPGPAPGLTPTPRHPRPVNPPAGGAVRSFEVVRLDGSPVVGSGRIDQEGRLGVGEWLVTDGQSRAQINIADIGKVEVEPNSRIGLIATRPTEHRLKLARGRMQARISAPPRLFIVETPTAVAVDLGCEYALEVDESGASVLRVASGYVALEFPGRESIVPAGAVCETRPGLGPGTPYFEDATQAFRRALADFDFAPQGHDSLRIIVNEARRRDTLTLWHLLRRVKEAERKSVLDRMIELYGPPEGVTRSGLLSLDPKMLELYRKRLAWVW